MSLQQQTLSVLEPKYILDYRMWIFKACITFEMFFPMEYSRIITINSVIINCGGVYSHQVKKCFYSYTFSKALENEKRKVSIFLF